jgi:hypothetical protein
LWCNTEGGSTQNYWIIANFCSQTHTGTKGRWVWLYVTTFTDTIRGSETILPLTDWSANECTTDTRAEAMKAENRGILWFILFS